MAKPTRVQRALLAAAALGAAVSLVLRQLHPFGTGDWQEFLMALPIGVGIGISLGVLIKMRRTR